MSASPRFPSHLKTQLNIGFQIMIGCCGSKPVIVFVPGNSMWWYKYTAAHIFIYVVMESNNFCAKLQAHVACYIVGYETIVYKLYDAYLTITVALNMYIAALRQRKRLCNKLGDSFFEIESWYQLNARPYWSVIILMVGSIITEIKGIC